MFVANKALDVGEQCLPFAAVIGETTVEAEVVMKIKDKDRALCNLVVVVILEAT